MSGYYDPSFSRPSSRPGSLAASRANSYIQSRNNSIVQSRNNSFTAASTPVTPRARSTAATTPQAYLSRTNSKDEDELDVPDHNSEVVRNEKGEPMIGRIVGGKHVSEENNDVDADCGPITTVDIDMPLTLTETVKHNDKEYIILTFATGDKENPFNWNPWYKRSITTMLNLMTLFIGLATTAYSSGINSMCEEFNVGSLQGQWGLFTFNMACAVAPMVLAPFCELVGRKIVYASAYLCFSLLFIGLALAPGINTIIGLRLLLGLFGCVGTILVGGTFDDMYPAHKRGRPMAMFSFVAIFGTVSAPIYAGFIDQAIGWRW